MNSKNCFDFLRFFFAVNILLAHLSELSQSKSLLFLSAISNSMIGVRGFFVISGFLVVKSYIETPSLKDYFIKRIRRILPAYVFVVLFFTLFLSICSSNSFSEYFSNINVYKYLGWNLLFLNFMHPCLPGLFENNLYCAVNGALWTLKVEIGFYLVLPLIFFVIKKTRKRFLILISLYVLSVVYWLLLNFYLDKPEMARQLPGYLSYFLIGVFMFLSFDCVMRNKKILLGLSFMVFISYYLLSFQMELFYPAAFGIILIIAAYNIPFLNNFGKYGDFTYGLYIYHFPLIQIFRQYNLFEKNNPFLMAIAVILISISLAVFSWFCIEKRFLKRFNKRELKKIPWHAD